MAGGAGSRQGCRRLTTKSFRDSGSRKPHDGQNQLLSGQFLPFLRRHLSCLRFIICSYTRTPRNHSGPHSALLSFLFEQFDLK